MADKILNGSDLMLFLTTGGATKTIAFATQHKVSMKMKTRDIGSKDSGIWEEKAPGKLGWSISADAMVASDVATFGYDDIYGLMVARTAIDIYSTLATGSAPGWVKAAAGGYTGKAIITALDIDAKDDDNATFSITLEGTGPYTAQV